jgi:hypothetical protein
MHIMRRGQAEFALILGIVIVAVIVAAYAFSSGYITPAGPALSDEQKAVETYVLDVSRVSAGRILGYVYDQGGYVNPPDESNDGVRFVDYAGKKVAYWQICQHDFSESKEDMETQIESGMERLLRNALPEKTDIAGNVVEFSLDEIDVDATIYQEKVSISAVIPTKTKDGMRREPYTIEVQSELGRIRDFAEDFTWSQEKYRMLDSNLLMLMELSDPEEKSTWIPLNDVWSDGYLKIKWNDMKSRMKKLVDHTLTHTRFWERSELINDDLSAVQMDYAYIPQIENRQDPDGDWIQYTDLDVELRYGGWGEELRKAGSGANEFRLSFDPDPVVFAPTNFGLFAVPAYQNVKYQISFPVLVSVNDDSLGKAFKFMTFVNIRHVGDDATGLNKGVDCNVEDLDIEIYDPVAAACENNANMPLKLTVVDYDNNGIPGVSFGFGDCYYDWVTDGDGKLGYDSVLNIPDKSNSALELLLASGNDVTMYKECGLSSSQLNGRTVEMPIKESFEMKLYSVNIIDHGASMTIQSIKEVHPYDFTQVDVYMTKRAGSCPDDEGMTYTFDNYVYEPPDIDNLFDPNANPLDSIDQISNIETPEGGMDPPVTLGEITENAVGNPIKLDVTETYDVEVDAKSSQAETKYGKIIVENFVLDGSTEYTIVSDSGANRIYVYVPHIISGGFTDGEEVKVKSLYQHCKLPVLSEKGLSAYNSAYNPSIPLSTGVLGCEY